MTTGTKIQIDTTIEADDAAFSIRGVEPVEGHPSSVRFTVVGEFKGLKTELETISHLKDGQTAKNTDAYRGACISIRGDLQYKFNEIAWWLVRRNPGMSFGCRDVAFPPHRPWTPATSQFSDEDRETLLRVDDQS